MAARERKLFLRVFLGLWVGLFALMGGLRWTDDWHSSVEWSRPAGAAVTTFMPLSSLSQVTTLDPRSIVLVSVPNTGTTNYLSRSILATNAFRWFLTTFDASAYLTSGSMFQQGYITSAGLDLRGYITSGSMFSQGYMTSGGVFGQGYMTSSGLASRNYLTTYETPAYVATIGLVTPISDRLSTLTDQTHYGSWITTGLIKTTFMEAMGAGGPDDAHDALRWNLTTWNITTGPYNQFGGILTGSRTMLVQPRTFASGEWSGPAVLGNVLANVSTLGVVYLSTSGWVPYSASIHTFALPGAVAPFALTTAAPGLLLLDGALVRITGAALGTATNIYYASTLAGGWQPAPPGSAGMVNCTVWQRISEDLIQVFLGRFWGKN